MSQAEPGADEAPSPTLSETGDETMTDKNVVKLKMVAALLEAIDIEDEEDAKEAVKQIRALMGGDKGEAK